MSPGVAGFSLADSQGVIRGIDADGCRTVAAAVLGDATKVRFVPTTTITRFTALQSGEIDVLIGKPPGRWAAKAASASNSPG